MSTEVPNECHEVCDEAEIIGQEIGEVPALCVQLTPCTRCLVEYGSDTTVVSGPPDPLYQWISYCKTVGGGSEASSSAQSVLAKASSQASSQLASVSSQEAALSQSSASLASVKASADSALGITASPSTVTTTSSYTSSTYISSSSSTLSTPQATNTPSPMPIPNHKAKTGTIIGAAVGGSIGGIILIGLLFGFFTMRRRRKQLKAILAANKPPEKPYEPPEKPQLHSDDYKPHREELLGTLGKKQYDHTALSVLPSNEPAKKTKELHALPANEEVGAELEHRVKTPHKMDENSQSTKVGSGSNDQTKL